MDPDKFLFDSFDSDPDPHQLPYMRLIPSVEVCKRRLVLVAAVAGSSCCAVALVRNRPAVVVVVVAARNCSADVVEMHAMVRSAMWCLQYGFDRVRMCFDSAYAHGTANGVYSPSVNQDTVMFLGGLRDMLKEVSTVA